MRRTVAAFVTLFLAWSLFPGSVELVENASHLVVHGDLAHDQGRPGHSGFNPEHGCASGLHLCSCCHSPLSDSASAPMFVGSESPLGRLLLEREGSPDRGFAKDRFWPPRS